jgi:four helix bundle protein
MKVEKFEDLIVWKDSMRLAVEVYEQLKECRDFSFRDQIQRSSVSVPSNIAEGYERQSNKEFIQYLYIAKGSCGELRTQIYLAINIGIMDKEKGMELIEKTKKISAMLYGLIQTRKDKF